MTTFKPDHKGECLNCDEPGDAHICEPALTALLERWDAGIAKVPTVSAYDEGSGLF